MSDDGRLSVDVNVKLYGTMNFKNCVPSSVQCIKKSLPILGGVFILIFSIVLILLLLLLLLLLLFLLLLLKPSV